MILKLAILILLILPLFSANKTNGYYFNKEEEKDNDTSYLDYICPRTENLLHTIIEKDPKRLSPTGIPCFVQWNEDNTNYPNPHKLDCMRNYIKGGLSEWKCREHDKLPTRYIIDYEIDCFYINEEGSGLPKDTTNPSYHVHKLHQGTYCRAGFNVLNNKAWLSCWWWSLLLIVLSLFGFCFSFMTKTEIWGSIFAIMGLFIGVIPGSLMLFIYEVAHTLNITTCIVFNFIFTILMLLTTGFHIFYNLRKSIDRLADEKHKERLQRKYREKLGVNLQDAGLGAYVYQGGGGVEKPNIESDSEKGIGDESKDDDDKESHVRKVVTPADDVKKDPYKAS